MRLLLTALLVTITVSIGEHRPRPRLDAALLRARGGATTVADVPRALRPDRRAARPAAKGEQQVPTGPRAEVVKALDRRLFVSLAGMLFFALFSYQLLQSTKDTIIVDACGAEAITFVKVYGVLPTSMLFLSMHTRLPRTADDGRPRTDAYIATVLPFLLFFLVFGLILYPLRHVLHAEELPVLPSLFGSLGSADGLLSLRELARHWTFALYYIFCELYGNVGVSILFWQFCNQVVTLRQAGEFYPLLSRYTWIAPTLAGQALVLSDRLSRGRFEVALKVVTLLVTLSGAMMIALHRSALHTSRALARYERLHADDTVVIGAVKKRKGAKPGLVRSLRIVGSDSYLVCVALIVVCYGLCMNFTEVTWKTLLSNCYPTRGSYQKFLGWFSTFLGLSVWLSSMCAPTLLRVGGWRVGALTPPIVMAALALPLFGIALSTDAVAGSCARVAVIAGTVHNLASKALKFTLVDPCARATRPAPCVASGRCAGPPHPLTPTLPRLRRARARCPCRALLCCWLLAGLRTWPTCLCRTRSAAVRKRRSTCWAAASASPVPRCCSNSSSSRAAARSSAARASLVSCTPRPRSRGSSQSTG